MNPVVALTTTYAVVDELKAENNRLQEELALRDHRIDCLSQALDEAIASQARMAKEAEARHVYALRWKQSAKYWRKKARRNAVMFRRSKLCLS